MRIPTHTERRKGLRLRRQARGALTLWLAGSWSDVAHSCDRGARLLTLPSVSKGPKSNLAARVITAVVAAPLLLGLLFVGPSQAWALLVGAACCLAGREFLKMTHPGDTPSQLAGVVATGLMAAATYLGAQEPPILLSALLLVPILSAMVPLWRLGDISTAGIRIMSGIAAPVYAGVLLMTLALLRRDVTDGAWFVFYALTIAWMGDTGGYTFGRLFGKTKLYEAVSPKKTREGFLGSVVFATASTVIASFTYLPRVPWFHSIALGVVGSMLGQAGDLVESLLKRSTGIKDSGSLLPGHGGILDRVDALMVVGPLVYLYTLWVL